MQLKRLLQKAESLSWIVKAPFPWTSKKKIKQARKKATDLFSRALELIEGEEANFKEKLKLKARVHYELYKLTKDTHHLEEVKTLLNRRRLSDQKLTSGISAQELIQTTNYELQKSLPYAKREQLIERLDKRIHPSLEKLIEKEINSEFGFEAVKINEESIKFNPNLAEEELEYAILRLNQNPELTNLDSLNQKVGFFGLADPTLLSTGNKSDLPGKNEIYFTRPATLAEVLGVGLSVPKKAKEFFSADKVYAIKLMKGEDTLVKWETKKVPKNAQTLTANYKGLKLKVLYKGAETFKQTILKEEMRSLFKTLLSDFKNELQNGFLTDEDAEFLVRNYFGQFVRNIEEHRKKKRKKKAFALGSLLIGTGLITSFGLFPAEVTHHSKDLAHLSDVDDVYLLDNSVEKLPILAKSNYTKYDDLFARIFWQDNGTIVSTVPLGSSTEGIYKGIATLDARQFPLGKSELTVKLLRYDPIKDKELLQDLDTFFVYKRSRVNLPPVIDISATPVGKDSYAVQIKITDSPRDDMPGFDDVYVFFNGKEKMHTKQSKINMQVNLEREGDNTIKVRAFDAENFSLYSEAKKILYKNKHPNLKARILSDKDDKFIFGIYYSDDGRIMQLPVNISKNGKEVIKIDLVPDPKGIYDLPVDLSTAEPGKYTFTVSATDNENATSTVSFDFNVRNDPIKFDVKSIKKVAGKNDTFDYEVEWSKPDGSVYSLTLRVENPENKEIEYEKKFKNTDLSKRRGTLDGRVDLHEKLPKPEKRKLVAEGIDEYYSTTVADLGEIITLENNRAWVWSRITSENGNKTGNYFSVDINSVDEDTLTVNYTVLVKRGDKVLSQYFEEPNKKSFSSSASLDLSAVEPGNATVVGILKDELGDTYEVFKQNIHIINDAPIIKDFKIKYNPLSVKVGGKKLRINATYEDPDNAIKEAELRIFNDFIGVDRTYSLPVNDKETNHLVDISDLPPGIYGCELKIRDNGGLENIISSHFEKNESYEIELIRPDFNNTVPKLEWDYERGIAKLTLLGEKHVELEELKDFYTKVPKDVREYFLDNFYLYNACKENPLYNRLNLSTMLHEQFLMSGDTFLTNFTALYRYLIYNMTKDTRLSERAHKIWETTHIFLISYKNDSLASLLMSDLNLNNVYDNNVMGQPEGYINLSVYLRKISPDYLIDSSYSQKYDRDKGVNWAAYNLYRTSYNFPNWYDVENDSESKFCSDLFNTPEKVENLKDIERVLISFEKLDVPLDHPQKLKIKYSVVEKGWQFRVLEA